MKPSVMVGIAVVFVILISESHAEDWKVKGKTYRNIHVLGVNPDTVSVTYDGGTGRIALSDLSPELQMKFGDAAKEAKAFALVEKDAATDPIAHLVVTLSASGGMWVNGPCQIINSPKNAPPEELVPIALKQIRSKNYKILRVEQVQIDSTSHTAVLVRTETTDKIIILSFIDPGRGWWDRVYDSGL